MSRGRHDGLKTAAITVLGSGFAPFASGSWGSATALALFLPAAFGVAPLGSFAVNAVILAGILLASVLSVAWGEWAIARFGRKDPKPFVLDEFAGQWVALVALPVAYEGNLALLAAVLASQFLFFRAFDVVKPPPARQLEALPAGWGVLCDDLFAGLYANLAGQVLWSWTPLGGWLLARLSGAGG